MKGKNYFFFVFFFLSSFMTEGSQFYKVSSRDQKAKEGRENSIEFVEKNHQKKQPFLGENTKISVESLLSIRKNDLLSEPYDWSLVPPESELTLSYPFKSGSLFEIGYDFSYRRGKWSYRLDKLFLHYTFDRSLSPYFKVGYFYYPVSFKGQNISEFIKKTLVHKRVFPFGGGATGVGFGSKLKGPFLWNVSLQGYTKRRKTDQVRRPGLNPSVAGSLIYKNQRQKGFLSYFQKDLPLDDFMESVGLGARLFYDFRSLSFRFKGELWGIRRYQPLHYITTFYVFPSVRWNRFDVGILFGGSHHFLKGSHTHSLEYIFKLDFYLTEDIIFRVERNREQDQIVRESFWSFSVRTDFNI